MYLHLGQDSIVRQQDIVAIFDLDNASASKHTRDFLARAEREGRVVVVSEELPKSMILCKEDGRETVYLSQVSTATLLKRNSMGL